VALEDEKSIELKRLIEESKEKLKLKNAALDQIKKELLLKRKEIVEAEINLIKFKPSKIFTKKEIKNIEREEIEKKKLEFKMLKINIDKETNKALAKAEEIRLNALGGSEGEIKDAENLAFEIEKKALTKKAYVLGCILDEKDQIYQELLAEKVCQENNLKKLKNSFSSDAKAEINSIKSKIKILAERCWNLNKEIQTVNFRIEKFKSWTKKKCKLI